MKITNNHDVPPLIYLAITNDVYNPGEPSDISVTQLIAPPQQVRIKRKHLHEIAKDASDMSYLFHGQLVHSVLERIVLPGSVKEERYYGDFDGKVLSGQIDIWHDGVLTDFKATSIWKVKRVLDEGGNDEWEAQLNVYAHLMRMNGYEVNKICINTIVHDYKKSDSKRMKDYPPRFLQIDFPIWSDIKCESYIRRRLTLHFQNDMVECSDSDRWLRGEKWAVMKKGRKSALRLLDTEKSAISWNIRNADKGGTHIEHRPGEYLRCAEYCDAAPWCEQYRE